MHSPASKLFPASPCVRLLLAAILGAASSEAVLLISPTNNRSAGTSGTGSTSFNHVRGTGWVVANESEASVSASLSLNDYSLSGGDPLRLSLTHSYNFEYDLGGQASPSAVGNARDGAVVEYSVNGGSFQVFSNWNTGGYTIDSDGVDALGGSLGWSSVATEVTSVGVLSGLQAGDSLQFRFTAAWDEDGFASGDAWELRFFELTSDSSLAVIPEPAMASLFVGLAILGLRGRRRR